VILLVVDQAGVLEWAAIGLAFVAVILILRYWSRPRCALCRRRHHGAAVAPSRWVVPPVSSDVIEIDLTALDRNGNPPAPQPEPIAVQLAAISWRADGAPIAAGPTGGPTPA
jgi:hypothetical protein